MAIDKKLIHFKQWSTFISESGVNGNYTTPSSGTAGSGSALYGQIKETSIVFIQDVQRIWTHGKLYECSAPDLSKYLTAEDLSDLNSFVSKCSVTKTGSGNGETLTVTIGDTSNSVTNTWRTIQVDGSSISNNVLNLKSGTNVTLSKSNGTVTINGANFPTSLPADGGTADKADTLTTARTIDGVDFNGSANITHYGTCGTAAGTAAKTVSLTGYKLATGAKVAVKFTVTNTAANPTLNVNSTGAKAIYYRGAAISKGYLAANRVYEFVYDGTHYELIGDINTDTDNNTAHSHSVGTGLSSSGSGGTSGTTTYSLKTAATDEIGGIKVASVGTAASGANTTVNANKFAVHVDSNGLGYVAIPQYSNNSGDITGVTAGSGLTGGATSGNATVSHADTSTLEGSYGQESDVTQSAKNTASFVVPQITVDGFGHVTGIANKTITVTDTNTTYSSLKNPTSLTLKYNDTQSFTYDGSAAKTLNIKPGSNVSVSGDSSGNITIAATDTKYSAGSGLTLSGTTFNHSNSVEGSAICNSTATSGKTITIPHFTFDDQGHITAAGTRTHTVSGFTNNSGTVTSITPGTGLTGTSSDVAITTSGTINLKSATTSEIGGIKVAKDNASYAVATNTSPDITADVTTAGKYYGVEIDKNDKAYVYVPWTDNNTTSFTITATATDDDVVVLTGTNGTNKTTYDAKHAKTFGNTTAPYTAKYTSGNTTTSISGSGASSTIKIPQITVDEYGHVRAAADESITITMPTIPTIPSLSGGAAAESGKYVSGVTVSGHTVTVAKGTLPTIPTALKNPNALTFGSKTYDGSEAKTITAADLGLGTALKFHGTSKTAITDGSTTQTVTLSDNSSHTAENGCVLFYGNKEFVWNGSSWEELGNEGNYKVKQTAVSSPTASGNTTAFIDTISQNENGVISATKKYITNNVTYTGTLVDEQVAVFEGTSGQVKASGYTIAKSVPSDAKFTDTHWTTRLYAGASGTAANAAASNPYLKVTDDNTYRNQVQFAGAGTVSVASDAAGKITITGSAHPTSLPASDVYPWAKAKNKPTYTATEVGALPITGGAIGEGNANNFPITISSTAAYTGIAFTTSGGTGYMRYLGGSDWGVTNNGWTASYTLLHSGNYNSYAPKLDGTGASGTWGIDITGSAVQLTAQTLFPNTADTAQKWRRFAKLELKYQYKGTCANFQLRVNTSTQQSGDSCEVYATMYQQAALGQAPVYTIKTNCSDTRLKIIGVLNYSTSGDTLELYAYCPYSYYSVSVSSLYDPDNTLSIGTSYVASLPSGTQITPIQMGTSYSANKLTTARTIWGQSFDGTGNISGTLSSVNNIYPNSSAEKYIGKSDNPFKYVYAEWFGAGTGKSLSFGANNGTHIWVTTSGNVGINNSNPASKLHVTGGITATSAEYSFHADMPASTATYRHAFAGYAALTKGQYATIEVGHSSKTKNTAYLGYYHDGDGSNANRLTLGIHSVDNVFNITAAGNVGIGTTAPSHKFQVAGNGYVGGWLVSTGKLGCSNETTCGAYLEAGDDGTYAGIYTSNKGNWQSSNIYLHNNGNVTMNKYLIVNSGTTLKSTLAVTGATTLSSTLAVAGITTFDQEVRLKIGIRPDANNSRYIGTSSYRFNEAYIINIYSNDIWVGNGKTYGFKSDGSIAASTITASGNITTSGLVKIKDASIIYDSTQKCIKFTF